MKSWKFATILTALFSVCTLAMVASRQHPAFAAEEKQPAMQLAHNVFFTLNDSTPANRQKLVDACKKYLVNHPGVTYFACGTVCEELDRPVNDRNFDVGLHVVFVDRAAHDVYQTAPDHLKFIAENRETWKQVRVFDTNVESLTPKL